MSAIMVIETLRFMQLPLQTRKKVITTATTRFAQQDTLETIIFEQHGLNLPHESTTNNGKILIIRECAADEKILASRESQKSQDTVTLSFSLAREQ